MSESDAPALCVSQLRKSYGPREVLKGVSFDVQVGEIRGLLGANGAGKSTLIGCLSGATKPDSGTIEVAGATHHGFTPRQAFAEGIAVIYQHFSVIPSLTVADNVFLGDESSRMGRVDRKDQEEVTAGLMKSLAAEVDPRARVADLAVGERQLVEIAKVMRRNPRVLILDEPTAALSDQESRALADRLRSLRDRESVGIVYVSHLLHEVFDLVDSVTVLRDGTVALDAPDLGAVKPQEVVNAIAPSFDTEATRRSSGTTHTGEPGLEVTGLEVSFVGPLDIRVKRGERVALFGLLGSGRTETLEAIYGVRERNAGTVAFGGVRQTRQSPSASLAAGVAFVPGNRKERGIFAPLAASANVMLPHMRSVSRFGIRDLRRERSAFDDVAQSVNLSPPDANAAAGSFSGGNQQKLVISRWIVGCAGTRVLLLDEPTQGIDIGARGDVYDVIDRVTNDDGVSVLFATSDPDEAMQLADRVLVLARGVVVLDTRPTDTSVEDLLHAAHGLAAATTIEKQDIS